jgi:polysaccharide biosynthesis protein PslG
MVGRRIARLVVVALLAALVGALAAAPASAERIRPPGKKAQHIKTQLEKRLQGRGLDNVDVRRCLFAQRMLRGKRAIECTWYAEGVLPGPQPYRCHGDSLHGKRSDGRVGFIRISACLNKAPVQIPVAPAPTHEPTFGYNDEWHNASATMLDLFDRLQPDFARFGLDWSAVERSRGNYDWSIYDRIYADLRARGIRPLWTLGNAPCFYQDGPCRGKARPGEAHYDRMADFAAATARRYPDIAAFEVLNEPNTAKYWGSNPEPDLYAELFKKVAAAVERADSDLPVYFGSLSPHRESDADGSTISAAEFLSQGYDLGAVQMSDGISTHPYPGKDANLEQEVSIRLGDLYQVMSNEGDVSSTGYKKPLVITETGVSTRDGYTPEQQAESLVRIYDLVRRIPMVEMLIFHRFRDAQGDNVFEPGYGSVTETLQPKPAYCATGATRGLNVC